MRSRRMFSRALIGSLVATIASVPRRGCPDPAGRARVSGCRARRSGACQRGCRPRRIGNRGVPGESGRMTRWHSFCADRIARFRFLVLYDMRGSFRSITLHPHPVMRSRRTIVCSAPCVRRRLLPPHAGPDLAPSLPAAGRVRSGSPAWRSTHQDHAVPVCPRSVEPLRSASAEAGVVRACVLPEGTPIVRHSRPRRA